MEVLQKCDSLSIGFNGEEYPYVVPVSFGAVQKEGAVIIYSHGAKQGKKDDMLENNPTLINIDVRQVKYYYQFDKLCRGVI